MDLCLEILRAWQEEGVPGRRRRGSRSVRVLGREGSGGAGKELTRHTMSPWVGGPSGLSGSLTLSRKKLRSGLGVAMGGGSGGLPEDAQGTRNFPVPGREEGEGQRTLEAREGNAGDCPPGRMAGEVQGSWARGVRSHGWLRLISPCIDQPHCLPTCLPITLGAPER